jgi:hypothetical protein
MTDQLNVHALHVAEAQTLTTAERCRALQAALILTSKENQRLRVELDQAQADVHNTHVELLRIRRQHLRLILTRNGYVDVDQAGAPA